MIKVCLLGIGRTGIEIAKAILEQEDMQLVAAICSPGSQKSGKDLGELMGTAQTGITVESATKLEQTIFRTRPDIAVDFTNASAVMENAKVLAKMKVNLVIGTTGFNQADFRKLNAMTRLYRFGILYAPNITTGVNVLMVLSNLAANILNNYDFQITEIHHKNKKDSPSGTAIKIAGEIEKGLFSSGYNTGKPFIPIHAVRAGGVIGKHEVMIIGEDDKIEISHESYSRKAFAAGALKGIRFIFKRQGYFEMKDVLELSRVLADYLKEDSKTAEESRVIHHTELEVL